MTNAKIKTRRLADFGAHLRHVRLVIGMTQRELDRRSRVGYRFISELELGRENSSLATIILLADALGCELADLFPRAS